MKRRARVVVEARTCARNKYGHVCVHTGGVSNAYSHIRTARARVHGEAADDSNGVVFIGSQPAWTEQPKRDLAYRRTEETGLLFDHV